MPSPNETEGLEFFDSLSDFRLVDDSGETVSSIDHRDARALVVGFVDNTSPACRRIHSALGEVAREYHRRGVSTLVVNPSVDLDPEESADAMRQVAKEAGWRFPYLVDGDQEITRVFGVRRIPDFFVFDHNRRLAYHGRFDSGLPEVPSDGEDLREGLEAILGHEAFVLGRPTTGDHVRWRETPSSREPSLTVR
jgi:peroxiredoxin